MILPYPLNLAASQASSVYIHLPFCKTKCPYCDFASFADSNDERYQIYIDALLAEINYRLRHWSVSDQKLKTIFFGGGTPSLHSAEQLDQIFSALKKYFQFAEDIEISLEANPGTIAFAKLKEFCEIGVNRISIGVQTFDERLLAKLGRGHSLEDSFNSIENIKKLDFDSWSFDLIYGLANQSLDSWQETLKTALSFQPPHISAYALSIESSTPYGDIYGDSTHPELPQEDLLADMYQAANDAFAQADLQRYEVSNWALLGHEAKHNLCYWRAQPYFAFGLSAHGFINSERYKNTRDINQYLKRWQDASEKDLSADVYEKVSEDEHYREKILLALRLREGLELKQIDRSLIDEKALDILKIQGFLDFSTDTIKLTDKGIFVSNKVISELICDR